VWLDGTQVVNYTGSLGYSNNLYPEFGVYRVGAPIAETQSWRCRNYQQMLSL
jgi:hypothetical protein